MAIQYRIGVVTLLFNNNAFGDVRRDQMKRFDGRVVAGIWSIRTSSRSRNPSAPAPRVCHRQNSSARRWKSHGRGRPICDRDRIREGFRDHGPSFIRRSRSVSRETSSLSSRAKRPRPTCESGSKDQPELPSCLSAHLYLSQFRSSHLRVSSSC
jgi:hypothetical protein